ncbi:putative efflux protein, MATE family [Butyrivibrio fibrisolvens]|uniref:Probable multidrug resistance protein NorM n=1 Tax=Butyrivibrio fibrisolvens TaxID=831 RepID=A0A1H9QEM6_BUTFI|nr:MATE family efflux transporter [Butyrivibrio fibrisolvens]SER58857.1 putative efflux protein, MATE family [Butyrivibrio fibrisolvens]
MNTKNTNEYTSRQMLPVIFALAWPTMLEQFMQTAVQYIDTAMVGVLGTSATASVGATSTVNWLIGSTISALGVGFLAYISQSLGAGDTSRAKKAAGQSVFIVLVTGIFFTILLQLIKGFVPVWMQVDSSIQEDAATYFGILYAPILFRTASIIFGTELRAAGDTKTPMYIGIQVNLLNVILNYLLIYKTRIVSISAFKLTIPGAGLDIRGAALASAIAYTWGGIAISYKFLNHAMISPKGQKLNPDPLILSSVMKVAIPNMMQRFATSLGYVVFASIINAIGETATAAHTIANTVESAFYIPGWGMQTAAATLSGNAYGARDKKKLDILSKTVLPLEVFFMVISGGLLFIFAPFLVQLFTTDEKVITLATTVLRMVAVSEPFYGIPIIIEGMMQGLGKTVAPFIYNVLGMWCIRLTGTYICTVLLGMGLISAWACMIGHNILLFILFSYQYLSGRWRSGTMSV